MVAICLLISYNNINLFITNVIIIYMLHNQNTSILYSLPNLYDIYTKAKNYIFKKLLLHKKTKIIITKTDYQNTNHMLIIYFLMKNFIKILTSRFLMYLSIRELNDLSQQIFRQHYKKVIVTS